MLSTTLGNKQNNDRWDDLSIAHINENVRLAWQDLNFGRYAGELWRACRLVVDSGLHAKRWTRQQAINYLNENTASSAINNARAVDRYLAVPGQATAFKIGMMRILDVRQKASAALGDKFDIREFHQVILENGPIPLSIMEEQVEAWVRKKKTH